MAATGHTAAPSRPVGSDDLDVGAGHFSALGSSQRRNDHGSGVVRSGEAHARWGEADNGARMSTPDGEAVALQGRATSSHTLSSGGALQAGSSVQAAVGVGVAPALLDAALAALQPAEPFSRPSTTSVRPVTPVAGALDIDANQTIPGASTREASKATLVKTSARPVERMFRLSSFRDRLSPTSRDPSPPTPDDPSEGASHRPRFKRRFSRSLTSLQASLLAGNDAADDALGPDGPDEGGKLAKWRAKGKARLIAAFKTPTLESPPTSPEGSPSPFAPSLSPDLGRASSRSRSHSAPLFLPRAPMVPRQVHPQEVVAAAPPREPVDDLAAPAAPFSPLSPPPERRDSPEPYDFTTCPSSPFDEAPPVLVAPQPAVSTSPGLATLPPPPPAYFAVLPRELQLAVFAAVLDVCEDEWRKDVREGRWAGKKASERWSDGRAKGRRELVKLGRVRFSYSFHLACLWTPAHCERTPRLHAGVQGLARPLARWPAVVDGAGVDGPRGRHVHARGRRGRPARGGRVRHHARREGHGRHTQHGGARASFWQLADATGEDRPDGCVARQGCLFRPPTSH